ncbi:anti-sigma factor family protein [Myxococcota bacterium]
MTCPAIDELFAYLENEVSVARASEIEKHLTACGDCTERWGEISTMTGKIESEPGEFTNPAFVSEVVSKVKQGRVLSKKTWAFPWLIPAAASLAAAGLLFAVAPWDVVFDPDSTDGFAVRGSDVAAADRWVSFQVLRSQKDSHTYARVEQTISAEDLLVFSVTNARESPYRYFMILGVQADGRVFWYHPAFENPDTNPISVAVGTNDDPVHLREEIGHDLRSGGLRLFGLFSQEPLGVLSVEETVVDSFGSTGIEDLERLPIERTGQQSLLLHVAESAEGE